MKKVLLDCGTHYGEGLSMFIDFYKIDNTWEVYSFEPNKYLWEQHSKQNVNDNVHFINKAIYIHNDTITFNIAYPNTDASSIYGTHIGDNVHQQTVVDCLDLSDFILTNFSKEDFIVIKLDIEGAEYAVLRKMLEDNSILLVNDLYVEFHSHKDHNAITENGENKATTELLISQIQETGVNFSPWI